MKKKLLTVTLTVVLSVNATAMIPKADKFEQLLLISGMIVQNSYLVYHDIYSYTKPGMTVYGAEELNPVAATLFNRGQWDLGYALAIATQLAGNGLAYYLVPKGTLNWVVNASITCVEILAISTWNDEGLPKMDFRATALVVKF